MMLAALTIACVQETTWDLSAAEVSFLKHIVLHCYYL